MKNILKIFLIVILIYLININIYTRSNQIIKINGQILDYKWANNSNHLAVLFNDYNDNFFIYIINASDRKIIRKIFLSKFEFEHVSTFDWLKNDDGFLLGVEIEPFYPKYYQFYFKHENINLYPIEPNYCHIYNIEIETASDYYAVSEECEGCVDIFVYNNNNKLIFYTGEYLTCINLLKIKNNIIYLSTDIPFDKWGNIIKNDEALYLNWKIPEIEKSKRENYGGREDFLYNETYVFEVDILTGKVKKTDLYFKDLTNTSFDKNYYMTAEQKYTDNYKYSWFEIVIY